MNKDFILDYNRSQRQRKMDEALARGDIKAYNRMIRNERQNDKRNNLSVTKRLAVPIPRDSNKLRESPRNFIGIDGEGFDSSDGGPQRYVLLASSKSDPLYSAEGLSTLACFEYLISLKRNNPNHVFAGFSLDYDINHWLKDLPLSRLQRMQTRGEIVSWTTGKTRYRIKYVPHKFFILTKYHKIPGKWQFEREEGIRIWDVFGFVQSSFLNAIETWNLATDDEKALIARYKEARGTNLFNADDLDGITRYNALECDLLVRLMTAIDKTALDCTINLTSYSGAGSIAGAVMRRENVKDSLIRHEEQGALGSAIMSAYFGGRIQAPHIGRYKHVYAYDINSAYPAAMVNLPDLDGEWRPTDTFDADRIGIYYVEWDISPRLLAPFPTRLPGQKSIHYPLAGAGYYWNYEVDAALSAYGSCVKVHHGWAFYPRTPRKPFAYIRDLYLQKAEYKLTKDPRYQIVKLGINSMYGKLAQRVAYRGKPAYQSFVWSGLITSWTRSQLFRACYRCPDSIILLATDGIYLSRPIHHMDIGPDLGMWDDSTYDDVLVLQPGLYHDFGTNKLNKRRGYRDIELTPEVWDEVARSYETDGVDAVVPLQSRRFNTLFTARLKDDIDPRWRTWTEDTRKLKVRNSKLNYIGPYKSKYTTQSVYDYVASDVYKPERA